MKKQKELIKNTIILGIGKLSSQFISFLLLPLYTFFLSTEEYGFVDLVTTYVILLAPTLTLQLELAIFRYLIDFRDDDNQKKKIITNSYSLVFFISLFLSIIFIIVSSIFSIKYSGYLLFIVLAIISSSILLQTCRGLGDNLGYSLGCIITGVINIITVVILLVVFHFGIRSIFLSMIISNFAGAIFLYIRCHISKYFSLKYLDKSIQKELLAYSLPLIPNQLMWWIIDVSDRTLISLIINSSANGIYSISNKISHIINSLYNIFFLSWTESVSMYINDKDNFLNDIFNSCFSLICCICLCLMNCMFIIFPILVNVKFIEAYKYIPILLIATIFNILSANLSAIYVAKKETKKIAITTLIASFLNLIVNLLFIKKIGIYAAALSTLISFIVLFILRYVDIKKYVNIRLDKHKALLFTILFAVSLIVYGINNRFLNIVTLSFTIIIVCIINKEKLKKIYQKFLTFIKERRCVK